MAPPDQPPAGARTQKAAPPSSAAAAVAAAAPRRPKKKKAAAAPLPRGLRPVVQDGAWLRAQQARPGFLCADISQGAEVRKVPVFNEVDDEPPPQLQYVRCVAAAGSGECEHTGGTPVTAPRCMDGSAVVLSNKACLLTAHVHPVAWHLASHAACRESIVGSTAAQALLDQGR